MRAFGRVASAVFGAIAGVFLATITTTIVWFTLVWESVPCGATTCDNDGDVLAPVIVASLIGAATGAVLSWRRGRVSADNPPGPPSPPLR